MTTRTTKKAETVTTLASVKANAKAQRASKKTTAPAPKVSVTLSWNQYGGVELRCAEGYHITDAKRSYMKSVCSMVWHKRDKDHFYMQGAFDQEKYDLLKALFKDDGIQLPDEKKIPEVQMQAEAYRAEVASKKATKATATKSKSGSKKKTSAQSDDIAEMKLAINQLTQAMSLLLQAQVQPETK